MNTGCMEGPEAIYIYICLASIIEEQTDFETIFSVNQRLSRNTIRSFVKINIETANIYGLPVF